MEGLGYSLNRSSEPPIWHSGLYADHGRPQPQTDNTVITGCVDVPQSSLWHKLDWDLIYSDHYCTAVKLAYV